jgi:NTP pyrophosphatase (non-canonical NTP hydrolase)
MIHIEGKIREIEKQTLVKIIEERSMQDAKWGHGQLFKFTPHNFYAILGEEFGEVGKAINEGKYDDSKDSYVNELIQVAAVCVKAITAFELQKVVQQEKSEATCDNCMNNWKSDCEICEQSKG